MIRSKVFQLAAMAALMVGAQGAIACSTAAWTGSVTTATAGEPTAGFSRAAGRCSLRASAATQFVRDPTPNAEATLSVQYYFFTGGLGTGEVEIFQGQNAGGTNILRQTFDGSVIRFYVNGTAITTTVPALANQYYGVQMTWAASGSFTARVQTASGPTSFTVVTQNGITGGVIDNVNFGWISGGSIGAGQTPFFDEYDSRRTSNPQPLCYGDANGDKLLAIGDRVQLTNELAGTSLALGTPDYNMNGLVTVQDRVLLTNALAAGTLCAPAP